MQRIEDWLEKLGMSEYARRFSENDIDASVLRLLTDQDLKVRRSLRISVAPTLDLSVKLLTFDCAETTRHEQGSRQVSPAAPNACKGSRSDYY